MSIELFDFSWGRPGGAAIVAAGRRGVVRYIRPGDGRALTAAEVTDYRAHGLAIALVFEADANRALDGRAAGRADAKVANDRALALGFPIDIPIYFAVDFNVPATQYPLVDDYLRGAADFIGTSRVGVYGHRNLMAHCDRAGTAAWFWQTLAWSGGLVYAGNHLYQYQTGSTGAKPINGAAVDLDRSMKADYGQWDAPQEDPMAITLAPLTYSTMVLPKVGANVLDAPGGAKIIYVTKAGEAFPRVGDTGSYHVMRMPGNIAGFVAHGFLAQSDVPIVVPPAPAPVDTSPFSQADMDAFAATAVTAALDHVAPAATALVTAIDEARVR